LSTVFCLCLDGIKMTDKVKESYDSLYKEKGIAAQRSWPNEELCRFMGRNYFGLSRQDRAKISVLEVGCGSGGNLRMICAEGFDAYGVDLSDEGIKVCREILSSYGYTPNLSAQDMTKLNFPDNSFDVIVDVWSSCCLDIKAHAVLLSEVHRCLKPGGKFFSYFPSKDSDTYKDALAHEMLDANTIESITREASPLFGYDTQLQFISPIEYCASLFEAQLFPVYIEQNTRSSSGGEEIMAFVIVEAFKI
jgi:SAM-dependent methyltransferase